MKIKRSSKEEIVIVAKQLVREVGIDQLTTRELAKRCQLSLGTLYNYFSSKDHLLDEVAFSIWSEILGDIHEVTKLPLEEKVRSIVMSIRKGKKKYPRFSSRHVVLLETESDMPYVKRLNDMVAVLREGIVSDLKKLYHTPQCTT